MIGETGGSLGHYSGGSRLQERSEYGSEKLLSTPYRWGSIGFYLNGEG